jgi:nicotinamidase-related amidase
MKSAVLVIDVQNGVFGKDKTPYESNAVVERICEIAKNAKSRGNVVIYVQHEAPGIVEYGSEDWGFYHALPVEDGDVKIRGMFLLLMFWASFHRSVAGSLILRYALKQGVTSD